MDTDKIGEVIENDQYGRYPNRKDSEPVLIRAPTWGKGMYSIIKPDKTGQLDIGTWALATPEQIQAAFTEKKIKAEAEAEVEAEAEAEVEVKAEREVTNLNTRVLVVRKDGNMKEQSGKKHNLNM